MLQVKLDLALSEMKTLTKAAIRKRWNNQHPGFIQKDAYLLFDPPTASYHFPTTNRTQQTEAAHVLKVQGRGNTRLPLLQG